MKPTHERLMMSGGMVSSKTNFILKLSEKFGEDKQPNGRPMHEDPNPLPSDNEFSLSNDDSLMNLSNLKGERVDPLLRIMQVDKLLHKSEFLTTH